MSQIILESLKAFGAAGDEILLSGEGRAVCY